MEMNPLTNRSHSNKSRASFSGVVEVAEVSTAQLPPTRTASTTATVTTDNDVKSSTAPLSIPLLSHDNKPNSVLRRRVCRTSNTQSTVRSSTEVEATATTTTGAAATPSKDEEKKDDDGSAALEKDGLNDKGNGNGTVQQSSARRKTQAAPTPLVSNRTITTNELRPLKSSRFMFHDNNDNNAANNKTSVSNSNKQSCTPLSVSIDCRCSPTQEGGADGVATMVSSNALPLHLQDAFSGSDRCTACDYYRVVYRGIVALLAAPHRQAPRSGCYVSYGEILAMMKTKTTVTQPPCSDYNELKNDDADVKWTATAIEGNDDIAETAIRVDAVLTGGYAADASTFLDLNTHLPQQQQAFSQDLADTPKSSNSIANRISVATPRRGSIKRIPLWAPLPTSSLGQWQSDAVADATSYGYIFENRQDTVIIERLGRPPQTQLGPFHYKIIAASPIPILTGPSLDAPKTKALILPGTTHEISLRVSLDYDHEDVDNDAVWFLRLSHRRGWIADRKMIPNNSNKGNSTAPKSVIVVQEVTQILSSSASHADEDDASCASALSSSVASTVHATPGSLSRRRHRPPRRRIDVDTSNNNKQLPRHIAGISKATLLDHHHHGTTAASERLMTPSSNVSLLSDDSSLEQNGSIRHHHRYPVGQLPSSPELSYSTTRSNATTTSSSAAAAATTAVFFLMRVNAPNGLKILDAPHFQVSHLIRGKSTFSNNHNSSSLLLTNVSSSHSVSQMESNLLHHNRAHHHSIFQTMSGRLATTTTGPTSKTGNPAIFDISSKTRVLPCGALFEASRRMEISGATFRRGAGLIKLSDSSGWAIVPRQDELDYQYRHHRQHDHSNSLDREKQEERREAVDTIRAFEEVGSALVDQNMSVSDSADEDRRQCLWIRISSRPGLAISCPPAVSPMNHEDDETTTSPSSSRGSSMVNGSNVGSSVTAAGHIVAVAATSQDSDVASSVGSAFLDAMFRTPRKSGRETGDAAISTNYESQQQQATLPAVHAKDRLAPSNTIACGMCVEVEKWIDGSIHQHPSGAIGSAPEFARLKGGQGWIPLFVGGKAVVRKVLRPEFRFGSFWFRVQSSHGIKVRLGPSRKAPSIKSEEGEHFRFECGEFLRASEIMTVFSDTGDPVECFAKLYRHRHVLLHASHEDHYRPLPSLTVQAEWVQVYGEDELYLEECAAEPRIERHKQGWRYNVVPDEGVPIRKGPSFVALKTGLILFGGESIVINERVSPAGEKMTWLRMKDGKGWVHDIDEDGRQMMIPHMLRHRHQQSGHYTAGAGSTVPSSTLLSSSLVTSRPQKPPPPIAHRRNGSPQQHRPEIAYNTIIARLFHNHPDETTVGVTGSGHGNSNTILEGS